MSAEPAALGRLSQVALGSQDGGTECSFRWLTVASSGKTKTSHQKGNIDRAYAPGVPDSKHFELFRGGRDYCGHRWFRKGSTGVLDLKDPLDIYVSSNQFAGQKK